MNPNKPGGVPQPIEGEIERRFDPGHWKRKVQAQAMKGAMAYMQKGPLRAEDIEHFDAWKQDLILAIEVAALQGRKHWAMVNRLISIRMDKDVYATGASFFLEDEEEIKALDPKTLLQQIEEKLVTMAQVEQKRLRFKLAKQTVEENPWSYENRL